MIPSATWMISSIFPSASGFSIFAMTFAVPFFKPEELLQQLDIVSGSDKRKSQPVYLMLNRKVDVPKVLFSDRRNRKSESGGD